MYSYMKSGYGKKLAIDHPTICTQKAILRPTPIE